MGSGRRIQKGTKISLVEILDKDLKRVINIIDPKLKGFVQSVIFDEDRNAYVVCNNGIVKYGNEIKRRKNIGFEGSIDKG